MRADSGDGFAQPTSATYVRGTLGYSRGTHIRVTLGVLSGDSGVLCSEGLPLACTRYSRGTYRGTLHLQQTNKQTCAAQAPTSFDRYGRAGAAVTDKRHARPLPARVLRDR
jgi:hypothetical protein